MTQKTEKQDITSKQQDFSPEDLLTGKVVVDEISVGMKNQVHKFLENKFSSKIDAIVKDFDDDPNEDNSYSRTYLERRSPLAFSMSVGFRKRLAFHINWNHTEHRYNFEGEPTSFNEVAIIFEDGVTTRSAFGKKVHDSIERKRKIKYISKIVPTIVEILDRMIEITSKERDSFLESKRENEKFEAQEKLRDLKAELNSVRKFELNYQNYAPKGTSGEVANFFLAINTDLKDKIKTETSKLKEEDLL